ncbi:MAG: VOC family protein [Pseudomonadota bacterium]
MDRCFTNILSSDVGRTADFYADVLDMQRHFDSDWFVILTHPDIEGLELGVLQRDHDIVPQSARQAPSGVIVTFVVADCDAVYAKATSCNAEILEEPTDMFYGQRRMLLRDPDGTVVDVSAPLGSGAA